MVSMVREQCNLYETLDGSSEYMMWNRHLMPNTNYTMKAPLGSSLCIVNSNHGRSILFLAKK